MKKEISEKIQAILHNYDPSAPENTADALRDYWLTFSPKSIHVIKIEQRQEQETVGIPVPLLRDIGKEIAKIAKKRVDDFIPLTRLLWDEYGREGRVVTVYPLGAMELVQPEIMLPILIELCRSCITWEDSDQLSMRALEPIVRKDPDKWLPALDPWLVDKNKWVRRAGITAVGRLAMKHPQYTTRCLALAEGLLFDEELDVKRAVSFAIRLSARGDVVEVSKFLEKQVPPKNAMATWVLCDVIRSMTKSFLPEFVVLVPKYEAWAADPNLSKKDLRSVGSALKMLHKALS